MTTAAQIAGPATASSLNASAGFGVQHHPDLAEAPSVRRSSLWNKYTLASVIRSQQTLFAALPPTLPCAIRIYHLLDIRASRPHLY